MIGGNVRVAARRIGGLAALFTALMAASAGPAASEVDNPCQAPQASVTSAAPLPRLRALLQSGKPVRVLAIGSSSTVGVGASSILMNYPSRLSVELAKAFKDVSFTMDNRGVSGEVAAATALRIRQEVAAAKPDLVLWQVGVNDALQRVPIDDVARTVRDTLRWLKDSDIDAMIIGMQYTSALAQNEHYRAMAEALWQVSQQEGAPLVKRYEAMRHIAEAREKLALVSEDGLHLNDLGYRCMAEHVASGIVASVALRNGSAIAAQ